MKTTHPMKWFLSFLLILSLAGPAAADEVSGQIEEALKLYRQGRLGEAIAALDFASAQIHQMRADGVVNLFPAAPSGWMAETAQSSVVPTMLMGGGIQVSRMYRPVAGGAQSVQMEIITDSPLLQSFLGTFAQPLFMMGQPNARLTLIDGHRAVETYRPAERKGELTIVVRDRSLLRITGYGVASTTELMPFAKAFDFRKLEKLVD